MKKLNEMDSKELENFKLMVRERQQLGSDLWVPVSFVADAHGVSTRRIRALLAEGRIDGRQLENGFWQVSWPLRIQLGRRGPQIAFLQPKASKRPELKTV